MLRNVIQDSANKFQILRRGFKKFHFFCYPRLHKICSRSFRFLSWRLLPASETAAVTILKKIIKKLNINTWLACSRSKSDIRKYIFWSARVPIVSYSGRVTDRAADLGTKADTQQAVSILNTRIKIVKRQFNSCSRVLTRNCCQKNNIQWTFSCLFISSKIRISAINQREHVKRAFAVK